MMPQQEFEALFEKLEPWQQQWVACRALARILPIVGVRADFDFWRDPRRSLLALEAAPWLTSLQGIVDCELETASQVQSGFASGIDVYFAFLKTDVPQGREEFAAAFALFAAYASTEYVRQSVNIPIQPKEDYERAAEIDRNIAWLAWESAFATAIEDLIFFRRQKTKTRDPLLWNSFFGRPLWNPLSPRPEFVSRIVDRFEMALSGIGFELPGKRYATNCDRGFEFEETQQWLFGEIRVPSGTDSAEQREVIEKQVLEEPDDFQLPEISEWWIDLLYRLDLDDLGRTRVSVEPSLGTFEGAVRRSLEGESAAATSGLSKGGRSSQPGSESSSSKEKEPVRGSEVAAVAERLESQYGHLPGPPPLWRAWFQAVHGDRLRKIQDHFARGAE